MNMLNSQTAHALEKYGKEIIAVVLDPINSEFDCISITQCDELCNIDSGRELFRQHRNKALPSIKLHGKNIIPKLILTTPNCKIIADREAKRYKCPVQLIFNN